MTTTRKSPAAKTATAIDPIFAAIAEHKAREKEWLHLTGKLDDAKYIAQRKHGVRPNDWIWWRNVDVFYEDHLESRREEFLKQPGADREQIEKEYLDAKARLAAAERAGIEWDQRTGIAPDRKQYEHSNRAERRAAMRMARTKPTTPAGAAGLITYVRREIEACLGGVEEWQMPALKTAAAALAQMTREAA
jgi:hypothetical protein